MNYELSVFDRQVKKMLHKGQEVVMIGGSHALHRHEKLAIAVSKAMRGHSLQETKKDGRFHVHTKTYLDGAILREVVPDFPFLFSILRKFEIINAVGCEML